MTNNETRPPTVFISYSHDSPEHADRVLALSDHLRSDGIDCILDQYEESPPEGFPVWMDGQIQKADYVLMICTPTYYRRVMGEEEPGTGHGVAWESTLIYQYIYNAGTSNSRFIPVLLEGGDATDIPVPWRGVKYYRPATKDGYEELYRRLTGQPLTPKPVLGSLRTLPPRERTQDFIDDTPDEEKQTQSINENDPGNAPDDNSTIGSDQTTALDEEALFRRLSPSSRQALNEADGIRTALEQQALHMEHLIAGLLSKSGGPTEELLGKANIDAKTLGAVVETSFPQVGSYKPSELSTLPKISDHVRRALVAARDVAGLQEADPVRSRHLLYGALSIANCHVIQALLARGIRKEEINLDTLSLRSTISSWPPISGFASDDPGGQDLLDIKKEVEALCSVLAAKDVEPPLSLGLFGDWGSGKSFFLRMMQERIEQLKEAAQQAKGETAYCKQIVQLRFNAWHYIDTDLWASLTSEIFDGLASALVKKDDTNSEYKRARLLANTIKSKEELAKAEQEKKVADTQLLESELRLSQLKQDEATIEASLTPQAIIQGVWRVAIRQPEVQETIEEAKKELNDKMEEAAKELNYPTTDAMKADVKTQLMDLRGIGGTMQAFKIAMRNGGIVGRGSGSSWE